MKNGLTARTAVPLLGESREDFEELRDGLFADFQPKTVAGRELVNQLTQRFWALRRCTSFENAIADVAARRKLLNAMKGAQDQAKRTACSGGDAVMASRLSEVEAALYDPDLVGAGLQVAAADHMFGFATIAEIEGHVSRLLRQIERLIDELDRVESRFGKNASGRQSLCSNSGTGDGQAKQAREVAALVEDRDGEAMRAMGDILADPATPPHERAAIAEKLLARDHGKPVPSTEVTQEAQPTLAEEFEHYVRRLNDPNDREMQELQDRVAAEDDDLEFDWSEVTT